MGTSVTKLKQYADANQGAVVLGTIIVLVLAGLIVLFV
jgi:hypothetical protein